MYVFQETETQAGNLGVPFLSISHFVEISSFRTTRSIYYSIVYSSIFFISVRKANSPGSIITSVSRQNIFLTLDRASLLAVRKQHKLRFSSSDFSLSSEKMSSTNEKAAHGPARNRIYFPEARPHRYHHTLVTIRFLSSDVIEKLNGS